MNILIKIQNSVECQYVSLGQPNSTHQCKFVFLVSKFIPLHHWNYFILKSTHHVSWLKQPTTKFIKTTTTQARECFLPLETCARTMS